MLPSLLFVLALNDAPSVHIHPGSAPDLIEVRAVLAGKLLVDVPRGALRQEQGERWLRFCLVDPDKGGEGPAIFGRYRRDGDTLILVPRHALTLGQRYRAILDLGGGKRVTADHRVANVAVGPPAVVEKIYPSGDVVPANQLKFYLHFSKPMRETRAIFDQIQLLDQDGKPVTDPWRRTELWDANRQRLTMWIHPGRVKRGIGPRELEGPVLEANRKYTLVIGAEVADASGRPLGRKFTRTFRTTPEDRARPLPEKWTLQRPPVEGRQPLVVEFHEPLDRALLDRLLTVKDDRGRAVAGRIEAGKEERSWLFHPTAPWREANYTLEVDEELEDLAGNTPLRLFDVDLQGAAPRPPTLTLQFRPRS